MVPRPDMVTVSAQAKVTEALDLAIEHGFSRLPVVGDGVDDVAGHRLRQGPHAGRARGPRRRARGRRWPARPASCPRPSRSRALMREMQAEKFHMALRGRRVRRHRPASSPWRTASRSWSARSSTSTTSRTHDVEHLPTASCGSTAAWPSTSSTSCSAWPLPDEDWDTVGGFVFGTLGHVPAEGESVEFAGHRFVADKVDGRRISSVRGRRRCSTSAANGAAAVDGPEP